MVEVPTKLLPSELIVVLNEDIDNEYRIYLVGGTVRNLVLNISHMLIQVPDFDFVVFNLKDIKGFAKNIADRLNISFFELDEENAIYRIVSFDREHNQIKWQADFAAPKGVTIEEDLKARDFTINSIALDIRTGNLIDTCNGIEDLELGVIRTVSLNNIESDSLRILRAYRIAAQIYTYTNRIFHIEHTTKSFIKRVLFYSRLKAISPERISTELWLLLSQPKCFYYLEQLFEDGIWEIVFPEFTSLKSIPPNDFHHLSLWNHTLELVKQYEEVVVHEIPFSCLQFINSQRPSNIPLEAIVKMSCLLHDIGKPQTWEIKENNKHTFYGHDSLGAQISSVIAKRMVWSKTISKTIYQLIENHLRPFNLANNIKSNPTEKAERKFFRQLGCAFHPLIAVAWADMLSIKGPKVSPNIVQANEKRLRVLVENYKIFSEKEQEESPLLHGNLLVDAIREANLSPNKLIKELLFEIRDLQLEGILSSSSEAYKWFISESLKRKKLN